MPGSRPGLELGGTDLGRGGGDDGGGLDQHPPIGCWPRERGGGGLERKENAGWSEDRRLSDPSTLGAGARSIDTPPPPPASDLGAPSSEVTPPPLLGEF